MRQAKLIKKQQLDFLYETLDGQLIQNGITSVALIDLAGNILTDLSNGGDASQFSRANQAASMWQRKSHLV